MMLGLGDGEQEWVLIILYFCCMKKSIILPHCKSLLIRKLVLHYVETGEVMAVSPDECSDVQVTHRALMTVQASEGDTVDVADCGAAYRFMMALLAVTPGRWLLTGTPRLLERPMEELVEVLSGIGANIRRVSDGWLIEGNPLRAETLTVNCTRSSQFASALLLISSKLGLKKLNIVPANAGSLSYVRMTLACLHEQVDVPGVEPPSEIDRLPGDWSAAAFWYAQSLLHLGEEYELCALSLPSLQGDAVLAEWFARMGVQSTATTQGVRVWANGKPELPPMTFDVADHPDLVPVLAALACRLPADFTFLHIRNLRYKESDRAEQLAEQLAPFAEIMDLQEDILRIKGKSKIFWSQPPYRFHTMNDHRLAMAFLLFGKEAQLDNITCLRKSYPALITLI